MKPDKRIGKGEQINELASAYHDEEKVGCQNLKVGAKDHQRFQASYATILKARMTALKKRERKDKRKTTEVHKKQDGGSKKSTSKKT